MIKFNHSHLLSFINEPNRTKKSTYIYKIILLLKLYNLIIHDILTTTLVIKNENILKIFSFV